VKHSGLDLEAEDWIRNKGAKDLGEDNVPGSRKMKGEEMRMEIQVINQVQYR